MVAASAAEDLTRSTSSTPLGVDGSEVTAAPKLQLTAVISFPGIGISVVDETPRELLYMFIGGMQLMYLDFDTNTAVEFKINHLQIDNQLYLSPYPRLFYSVPADEHSFVHISLSKSKQYSDITYLYFFEILVQEMEITADEELLLALLKFADAATSYMRLQRDADLETQLFVRPVDAAMLALTADASVESDLIYIGWLTINTFKLSLSFLTTGAPDSGGINDAGYLEKLLRTGGFLANIDSAPICLNGLSIRHPFHSSSELVGIITQHYMRAGLHEVHKILGSADILGNPVSLVSNLGTGVYDFFNEPKAGLVTSPAEFARGVARGTTSLVKNSVFGVMNSVSKLTGSLTKAAAQVSMDAEWQRERAIRARNKPQHIGEGFTHGARDLGLGVIHGITGIIAQPIKGAQQEGGIGFVKGIGKGVTGAFLKPVVGMVDTVTNITEGIKNTTTYFDGDAMRSIREPRYFGRDQILRLYDADKAEGQAILRTLDNGKYHSHFYSLHEPLGDKRIVLLSDTALFYVQVRIRMNQESELSIKWLLNYKGMQCTTE
jgi:vacuolar protein sorting-associated protein 13A/C